ncbi:MAG: hypothetical protein H6Q36_427 [Chloroflexi bacterium]|nr:hypothetical protein [Chloroflexota bacterium]
MAGGKVSGPALLSGLLLAATCLVVGGDRTGRSSLDDARRAVARGDWAAGFAGYLALDRAGAGGAEVANGLALAAGRLVASLPTEPAALQRDVVGWLAGAGGEALLATALDRCTAPIPAGSFVMGDDSGRPDERPARMVSLDAYRIDRYEVTNVQYARFVVATGQAAPEYWVDGEYPPGEAAFPVLAVSWADAAAYCSWAGRRLPTEAEWERACRGPDGSVYPWGDTWDPLHANVASGLPPLGADPGSADPAWEVLAEAGSASGSEAGPAPRTVGSQPAGASSEAVLDLVGNAAEWVADWYNWDGYADLPDHNPIGTGPPVNHVVRGIGWLDRYGRPDLVATEARCSARNSSHALVDVRQGFRCAVSGLDVPADPPSLSRRSGVP